MPQSERVQAAVTNAQEERWLAHQICVPFVAWGTSTQLFGRATLLGLGAILFVTALLIGCVVIAHRWPQ